MRLQSKLIAAFATVAIVALAFSLFASLEIKRLGSVLYEVGVVRLPSIQGLNMMSESMLALDFSADRLRAQNLPMAERSETLARHAEARLRFDQGWRLYEPLPQTPEESVVWQQFVTAARSWQNLSDTTIGAVEKDRVGPVSSVVEETRTRQETRRLLAELTRINYEIVSDAQKQSIASKEDVTRLSHFMLLAGATGFLGALGVGLFMSRAISAPVVAITQVLDKVKRGDFSARLAPGGADEVGDISHMLNRMLESLRTEEARLQVLSDNLPDTVIYQITRDLDGTLRFLHLSAGVVRITGFSRQELQADAALFYSRVLEQDLPLLVEGRKASMANMSVLTSVVRFRRKDSAIRQLQFSSVPRQLPDGRIVWDGVATDITEKEAGALKVRESESRFRAIFDHAADAIGISHAGKVVMVNASFPALFGYENASEIVGRSVFDLIAPRSHNVVQARLAARAAGETIPSDYDLHGLRRDGSEFAMEIRSSPFQHDGETYIVAQHRDVSERQRIEQQIRSSNLALKTIRECNQHLVHAVSEGALLQNLCEVFAHNGQCSFAWAATSAHDTHNVFVPAAQAGNRHRPSDLLNQSWASMVAQRDLSHGTTHARWTVAREFQNEDTLRPWSEVAIVSGFDCCVVLPLSRNGDVLGFLALESKESDAFNDEELKLFAELADDVAFGLHALRERQLQSETESQVRALLAEAEQGRAALLSILEDQKLAEDALHESEERFRSAMHHSAIGMSLSDFDNRCFEVNDALCRIVGYTREELLLLDFSSLIHPEDRAENMRQFNQLLVGHATTCESERRYLHKDGHVVWVQVNVSLVRDPAGQALHFIWQTQDVSERRRTAAAREEILAQLRLALRAGHLGTFRRNVQTGVGTWDEQTFELIGRPESEGTPTLNEFLSMVHPEDRSRVTNALNSVPGPNQELSYAFRLSRKDGAIRHFVSYAVAETTSNGKPEWITGVFSDISVLIEAQDHLKASAQRLQLALATSKIGVWRYDLITQQTEWDERMFEICGIDRGSPIPDHKGFAALLVPEDQIVFRRAWDEMLNGGPDYRVQLRISTASGALRHIEGHAVVQRDELNRPKAVLGVNSDITEIVDATAESARLREQLQQAQKMEALGTMAAGVAHDFNNLLTGINGFVGLAASSLPPGHEAGGLLKQALRGAVNARDLVRRILDFSRGRGDQAQSRVDVGELIRDTAPLITAALPGNVSLSVALDEKVSAVLADPGQLQQVLLNLCINGSHAIGAKSGKLTVTLNDVLLADHELTGRRFPTGTPAGRFVCLSVADTGSGMNDATRQRIFEPFFTTKKPGVGTGLGLSIVRDIVTAHRGGIDLESQLGVGTTFRIYLPAAEVLVARTSPPSLNGPAETSARILVLDDEPTIAMVLRLSLQKNGYRPEVYTAASDAWKRFAHTPDDFDLLMVDHNMPDVSGIEFLERVRAVRPAVPVILMSGQLNVSDEERGSGRPGVHLLKKPFEMPDLFTVVRTSLSRPDSVRDEQTLP